MRKLNDKEIRAFLTAGTRTGKLAVTRLDGSPMVVPVWFAVDDDGTLLFTTWHETIKGKSLRRDGRVSLCVDEEQPPYAYVRVDGTVRSRRILQLLRTWATRIAGRYMGADARTSTGRATASPASCSCASGRRRSSLRPTSPTDGRRERLEDAAAPRGVRPGANPREA